MLTCLPFSAPAEASSPTVRGPSLIIANQIEETMDTLEPAVRAQQRITCRAGSAARREPCSRRPTQPPA